MPNLLRLPLTAEHVVTRGFVLDEAARGGRVPFDRDLFLASIINGSLEQPSVEPPSLPGLNWVPVESAADGWFSPPAFRRGGYLFAVVEAEREGVVLLNASSNGIAYVNGELRAGDPYAYGYLSLPIKLRKGFNTIVLSAGRGRCRLALLPASPNPVWRPADSTFPDFVAGNREPLWGALIVANPWERPAGDLEVQVRCGKTVRTARIPEVPGLGIRKVPVPIPIPPDLEAGKDRDLEVVLRHRRSPIDRTSVRLRVRKPFDSHKRTFFSSIDGSVQYYGVRPALNPSRGNAMVLTLHGASVEGIGQIDAYGSKDWATLVGPTNRRPYGFDWEDWGRLDALEVLEDARRRYPHDRRRTHVTGHSMGGHGTWALGSLYPDRFASVAPSAGWISFATYAGGRRASGERLAPVDELVRRASTDHDTLLRARNLRNQRVYVLHGDADDNVPVTEARRMRQELDSIAHPGYGYHEQPGAGHWWGNQCVDWQPLFDVLRESRLPERPSSVEFVTTNPALSWRMAWAGILQQEIAMLPSRIELGHRAADGVIVGTTRNVACLRIDRALLPKGVATARIELDGQSVDVGAQGELVLARTGVVWRVVNQPPTAEKNPHRGGPFKLAFQNRFLFVVGTGGTDAESSALLAKARFDAEQFQYRGNGAVDLVFDRDLRPTRTRDRSLIVYGNADTNRAWKMLLSDSPIQVRRGSVRVGDRQVNGDDLACLFLRPRRDSEVAHVGVMASSGARGQRLLERTPFLVSGVAYPDWTVVSARASEIGPEGVLAAGYFGNDWSVNAGESVWRGASRR